MEGTNLAMSKRLKDLEEELIRLPMTAGFIEQIQLLTQRYGKEYEESAEAILALVEKLDFDISRISKIYIYDYLKQMHYFLNYGSYGNKDYENIREEIYDNEEIMMNTYYPGLLMSYVYTTILYDKLKYCNEFFIPDLKKSAKGIEIGFGEGFYLWEILRKRKDVHIDGFDVSEYAMKFAQNLLDKGDVPEEQYCLAYGNVLEGINVEDSVYDFAVAAELIEHVPNPQDALREIARLVKPDGLLFLTTVIDSNHMDHITNFESINQIEKMIQKEGFCTVEKRQYVMTDDFPETKDKSKGIIFISRKM